MIRIALSDAKRRDVSSGGGVHCASTMSVRQSIQSISDTTSNALTHAASTQDEAATYDGATRDAVVRCVIAAHVIHIRSIVL